MIYLLYVLLFLSLFLNAYFIVNRKKATPDELLKDLEGKVKSKL